MADGWSRTTGGGSKAGGLAGGIVVLSGCVVLHGGHDGHGGHGLAIGIIRQTGTPRRVAMLAALQRRIGAAAVPWRRS